MKRYGANYSMLSQQSEWKHASFLTEVCSLMTGVLQVSQMKPSYLCLVGWTDRHIGLWLPDFDHREGVSRSFMQNMKGGSPSGMFHTCSDPKRSSESSSEDFLTFTVDGGMTFDYLVYQFMKQSTFNPQLFEGYFISKLLGRKNST